MIRISAKYIFDLPVHFLIKGERDSKSTSWCFDIDGSKVEMVVFHQKDGSVRAQGESLHTFSAMRVEITVSREHENLPVQGTREWEEFFWAAEDEYTQIAKIALNRVIRYFKYKLGNPLLNDLSFTEDHLFYNPKWFKETGEELVSGIHNYYGQHSPALSF